MLDKAKHRVVLIDILKDIYSDLDLRTKLGFKGGTAAMLFYDLPRFSVDLDFDLLEPDKKQQVFEKLQKILKRHGELRDAAEKRYTLFFLISYEKGQHTVKLDISKRKGFSVFHVKNYLGIPALIIKEDDMAATKISALLTRRIFAMRDAFDVWFFLKNKWTINEIVLKDNTGFSLKQALEKAIEQISNIDKTQVLKGLGELLDEKQKTWAKDKLIPDLLFYLKLYREIYVKKENH